MRRYSYIVLSAAGLLLLLAACVQGNTAPTVTIQSPADGTSVAEGNPVTLNAEATDAQDGDLSTAVSWTSDLDGDLDPNASGNVVLSVGTHTITASATDSLGLTGTDSVQVTVTPGVATHLVSDGISVHMLTVASDETEIVTTASIPDEGLLAGQRIFNMVHHPSLPLVYAVSANDCSGGADWCWGNGRIDAFRVVGDTITHEFAFLQDASLTGMSCAQQVSGYVGQEGECAPVGMTFSPDGTRLYVDDDYDDLVQVFTVDETGRLSFVTEGASTALHGLAIDPTATYLYNGQHVIEVTGDAPVDVTPGTGGNSTALVTLPGGPGLITTVGTNDIGVYDLADATAPAVVDELDLPDSNGARDLDYLPTLERIVSVGRDAVHSAAFDGATLSLDDSYAPPEVETVEYRGVALTEDGAYALAAWFTTDTEQQPGGVDLFSVAPDGTLTRLDRYEFSGSSRTVMRLP